jgi:hypothetical protein
VSEHEIRLALVLNGGVSLAVWMGGVAHELDLARRASAGPNAPPPKEYDSALSARCGELCSRERQHRQVVVDVIAGTSAGGLNGALLAMAIASGSTLDPPDEEPGPWLRQRWSALGALETGKLLPTPAGPDSPQWILDGDSAIRRAMWVARLVMTRLSRSSNATTTSRKPLAGHVGMEYVGATARFRRIEGMAMKLRMLMAGMSVSLLAFGAAACGDDDDDDVADGTRITSPEDGAEVTSPVRVTMETDEIDIVAIDDADPDDGHFHLMVDVGCVDEGEPIPVEEEGYNHYGDGSTSDELELEPGDYDLCLQVGDPGHIALDMTDEISITVTE